MKDINDIMPKVPNIKWGALMNKPPTNEKFKQIVETSVFCNEDNNIINDNYKISKDQKISIIPPIGGG